MAFSEVFSVNLSEDNESCTMFKVYRYQKEGDLDTGYVDIRNYKKINTCYYATSDGICYTRDEFLALIKPIVKHKNSSYESNGRIASILASSLVSFHLKNEIASYKLHVTNPELRVILTHIEAIEDIIRENTIVVL